MFIVVCVAFAIQHPLNDSHMVKPYSYFSPNLPPKGPITSTALNNIIVAISLCVHNSPSMMFTIFSLVFLWKVAQLQYFHYAMAYTDN
jgi:hypothetical protein